MAAQTKAQGQAHEPVKPFTVTHRMVAALAIPMTLAYITVPLLGLVDTAVAGRLGDAAILGGLAVGAVIIDVIYTTFNFLRSGTTGLTAQAVGKSDVTSQQAILIRALCIALLLGIVAIVLMVPFIDTALWMMDPGVAVSAAAREYLIIRMLGAPLELANYAVLGWLVGLGRSMTGLAVQIVLNATNAVLSIILALWLDYGLAGIAMGTILGNAAGLAFGLFFCWRLIDPSKRPSLARVMDREALMRFLNLNADIMLRSFLLLFAFAYFTSQGAGFGETTLAANAVLMNFFLISGYFLDGLATAAEQIVGRAVGANYRPAFWRGFWYTLLWNMLMAGALFALFILFGNQLVALITNLADVREEASLYLIFAAATALTGVVAFQMDGVYIGATWSREMSVWMVFSFMLYILSWQFLSAFGNTGLWIALHVFLATRGVTLGARLPRNARRTFLAPQGS